jgi:hypothetical protein
MPRPTRPFFVAGDKIAEMWAEFHQQFMQHSGLV